MDPEKFIHWMQSTVQAFGLDMLRMKGIISFAGDNDRLVVQAVHMLLEGGSQLPWKEGEERVTRPVFREKSSKGRDPCQLLEISRVAHRGGITSQT